jgi:hypothetical protein
MAEGGDDDVNVDDVAGSGSDNFYGIGGYKTTIRRINTASKLCDELQKLFEERAAIERAYSRSLNSWVDKWKERIEKAGETGTMLGGWHHVLVEGRSIADIHNTLREQLEGPLQNQIEEWKKVHMPKSMMSLKTAKRSVQAFQKAQEPWTQRKQKIDKAQKQLNTHNQAITTYRGQIQLKPGQDNRKIEAALQKEEKEAAETKADLEKKIKEMADYGDIYRREMKLEFDRCQGEEKDRINFFKRVFSDYHRVTDVASEFSRSHSNMKAGLETIDADADLATFSKLFGADMPFDLPIPPEYIEGASYSKTGTMRVATTADRPTAADAFKTAPPPPGGKPAQRSDSPPPSEYVEAIFEYKAAKPDEISFHVGEILQIVRDKPTDPGWLRGKRNNGDVGAFPGNYVKYS